MTTGSIKTRESHVVLVAVFDVSPAVAGLLMVPAPTPGAGLVKSCVASKLPRSREGILIYLELGFLLELILPLHDFIEVRKVPEHAIIVSNDVMCA
jgi:hypothetical protein